MFSAFCWIANFYNSTICRFENGKLCVSRDNSKKVCFVLLGYTFTWLVMRFFSDEWSTPHCDGLTWLLAFLFPALLSIGLQLFFRCIWVVFLLQLFGIVLVTGCLMNVL